MTAIVSYATYDDMVQTYGTDILDIVGDPQNTGVADAVVINKALMEATGIVNSYLTQRYDLPLPSIPAFLMTIAIDIAIYRMPLTRDKLTNEMRTRYEDAIAHLKDIAAGKAGLGFPTSADGSAPSPDAKASTVGLVGFSRRR